MRENERERERNKRKKRLYDTLKLSTRKILLRIKINLIDLHVNKTIVRNIYYIYIYIIYIYDKATNRFKK